MKAIFISDLHLMANNPVCRLDNIRIAQYKKLEFVLETAEENKACIIQAGDFFDSPRSWYLLPEIIGLLKRYESVGIYAIFGQHDTYMYSEKTRMATSLGILEKAGLVKILGPTPYSFADKSSAVWIYGCSYGQDIPDSRQVGFEQDTNVLVIHAPIAEAKLWEGHSITKPKEFLAYHNFDIVLVGDVHRSMFYANIEEGSVPSRFVVNTGPMIRKTAEDYMFSHTVKCYLYDSVEDSITGIAIPCELADKVLTRKHIRETGSDEALLADFINEVKKDYDIGIDFIANIWVVIKKSEVESPVVDILTDIIGEDLDGKD